MLGPIAAKFIDANRFGSAEPGQQNAITLGVARVVIGVQLVIAGFQLPAKYCKTRWLEMTIVLMPVMTIMWMATTACIVLTIPKLTLLGSMVIGAAVTCSDPILSQAVAKGPFADKYVPRALRELISAEAGANDGFALAFLLLAVYLIRHADPKTLTFKTPEIAAEVLGGGEKAVEAVGEVLAPGVEAAPAIAAPVSEAFGGTFGRSLLLLVNLSNARRRWLRERWKKVLAVLVVALAESCPRGLLRVGYTPFSCPSRSASSLAMAAWS